MVFAIGIQRIPLERVEVRQALDRFERTPTLVAPDEVGPHFGGQALSGTVQSGLLLGHEVVEPLDVLPQPPVNEVRAVAGPSRVWLWGRGRVGIRIVLRNVLPVLLRVADDELPRVYQPLPRVPFARFGIGVVIRHAAYPGLGDSV